MSLISSSSSAQTKGSLGHQQATYLQKLAHFFFLLTLDEDEALVYSNKAIDEFLKQDLADDLSNEHHLVRVCYFSLKQLWPSVKKEKRYNVSYKKGWSFKGPVELSSWASFRDHADMDEFSAVLLCRILKVSEKAVSKGLGLSVGTVRLRVARGLRVLGELCGKGGVTP